MLKIDFVITWVNQNDNEWQKKYKRFALNDKDSTKSIRYRDYGTLKYLLRGIDKYAPWVHHVFLVTDDQVPEWIDYDASKITIVDHKEIISSKYLPTFNSNVIDFNLVNIPNLAEHFVYFNDDMFLNAPVKSTDFFSKNGLPRDNFALNAIMPNTSFEHTYVNNLSIINGEFPKNNVIRNQFFKAFNFKNGVWNLITLCMMPFPRFSRFYDGHTPISFRRSNIKKVLSDHPEIQSTWTSRVRSKNDYSIWLARYFELVRGQFKPRNINFGKRYQLFNIESIIKDIDSSKTPLININDDERVTQDNFASYVKKISIAFEKKLGTKSVFEK